MPTMSELERQAMALPDSERATLAVLLLNPLPAVLFENDDGLAEARRRNDEMDRDPTASVALEEIRRSLGR